MVCFYFCYYSY